MLRKYSIFMVLLVATASLVGISSIYQPANVETQPQLQQPGTEGLISRDQQKSLNQAMGDTQLLDRLMPLIINRLDGKLLAQKVLPYLDLNVVMTERPGQKSTVKIGTGIHDFGIPQVVAGCAPGEAVVSGGYANGLKPGTDVRELFSRKSPTAGNQWMVSSIFYGDGDLSAFANCLDVELVLKDVQQPLNLLNLRKK